MCVHAGRFGRALQLFFIERRGAGDRAHKARERGAVPLQLLGRLLFGDCTECYRRSATHSSPLSPAPTMQHVLKGDPVAAIAARAADRAFPLLAMAPEATTKEAPCLLKFRRGAFVAGLPVCPVLLRYSFAHFNPGGREIPCLRGCLCWGPVCEAAVACPVRACCIGPCLLLRLLMPPRLALASPSPRLRLGPLLGAVPRVPTDGSGI